MATLKACLAVTKNFTADDFEALDSRARELAGNKALANSHYIRAAQDIIKTLEQDIQSLEQGVEPEAKVEKPQDTANADLTKNTPVPPSERLAKVRRSFERIRDDMFIIHSNAIEKLIENGDLDAAEAEIAQWKESRYQVAEQQRQPAGPALSKIAVDALNDNDLSTALEDLVENGSTKLARVLAERLLILLGGRTSVVIDPKLRGPDGDIAYGAASTSGQTIWINPNGGYNEETLLHETVHAASESVLAAPESSLTEAQLAAKRELQALWAEAKKRNLINKESPAFTNLSEFVTEAMTNEAMQILLSRQRWSASEMWSVFKKNLLRMLGIEKPETMLEATIAAMDTIFRAPVDKRAMENPARFSTSGDFQIDAKPGANIVRMAKLLGPKLYGTPEDLQKVSVKEIFQNSFDAVKTLIDKGTLKKGSIDINTDAHDRTITVIDNGSGMSPSVLANQFLQIAGTFKETERASGGLGIAKMLFLFANQSLDVITARDGKVATLNTSGEELMASLDGKGAAPKVAVSDLNGVYKKMFPDGHGTLIRVKVPEKYVDPSTNEEKDIPFSKWTSYGVLDYSPLFSNIEVKLNGDVQEIGAGFPAKDFTQLVNVNFEWGSARVYVTKDESREWSSNAHVLSNGLWQFSTKISSDPSSPWADPVKRKFYIDVSPKVRAEDAGYPFDLNRQQFSKSASGDFSQVLNYIALLYQSDELSNEVKSFGSIQYMTVRGGKIEVTAPKEVSPDVPTEGPVAAIKPGDTVTVEEGRLIVNGREVPELTKDDLKKARIDVDSLRIDQSEIDPNRVMLHDNLEVVVASDDLSRAEEELAQVVKDFAAAEKVADDLQGLLLDARRSGDEELADKLERRFKAARNKKWDIDTKQWELKERVDELRTKSTTAPITEAARKKFGARFDEYVFGIGDTLLKLRNLVADVMNYPDLKNEGMGISFDKEYRGVSIRLPFAAMFINPAVPEFTDPARAAYGMFGTMIHEFAHHKVRSHDANFPAEMQRILIQLDAQDKVDVVKLKKHLVEHVRRYEDVLQWLNERNIDENSKPRGRRFKDGAEQSRFGDDTGNVGVAGQGAERQRGVSDRAVQGRGIGQERANGAARGTGRSTGQAVSAARQAVNDMADKFSVDGMGKAKEAVLASSFLRDLGSRFGSKLQGVSDYVKATFEMSARAADLQEAATKVQDAFNGLPAQERKQLMEFMADATAADVVVEPNEYRNNEHLTRMVDGERVEDPVVKEMQDRFAKLSAKQKAAYRTARNSLADNWKRRGALLARAADDIYNPLIEAARTAGNDVQVRQLERQRREFLDDTNKRLSEIRGDYFPMLRFGDWVVVRKSEAYESLQDEVNTAYKALEALYARYDKHTPEQLKVIREANKKLRAAGQEVIGEYTEEEAEQIKAARRVYNDLQVKLEGMKSSENDYYMAQFESESEAKRHAAEIGGTVALKRENQRELNPINRTMLTRLEESLAAGLRSRGDTSALREAKKAMYEVFLQTLPERSALLRQSKRKNVAGFDRDMERAIISTMLRDSFYLSRMEFGDKIGEALNTAYRDAQDKKDVDLQRVHNELARRLAASLRYVDTPIQDALAGITYIYKLGVSPGYLLANMTQPFAVSMPMMWARHGAKSVATFGKAWGQTVKMVSNSLKASLGRGEIDFENAGLPADEVAMLREMLRNRLLSVTMVADLARTADGMPTSKFASLMAKPSHFVEVLNRISTALAAYRLEKAKSNSRAATAYAARVLADTHFDYSVENAPYWMKPGTVPMNKVLFQFKKYQLGMISMFVKAAAAMAGSNKVAKKEAMAQVFGMLSTHLAIGGVLGLPGIGLGLTLANIVAKAFGDDDEPWDAEVALRNYLADEFGKEEGAALSKGLPTLVGADLSKKVGLGDLLNPVPTLRDDKKGRDFVLELLAAAAGPAVGLGLQFGDAANYFAKGDFLKGTEQMLPKWIADPLRAGRFATEGITTKQGTVALDREAISAWDVALQAAGLPAARITDSYEARAAIEGKKSAMAATASEYKKDWLEARRDGDNAKAEEIWQDIKTRTNPARVRNGLEPITKSDLFKFERQQGKTEKKYATVGGNTNEKLGNVGRFALQ